MKTCNKVLMANIIQAVTMSIQETANASVDTTIRSTSRRMGASCSTSESVAIEIKNILVAGVN